LFGAAEPAVGHSTLKVDAAVETELKGVVDASVERSTAGERPIVPEKNRSVQLEPTSLITRTDLHLVLLSIAVLLAIFDARFDLLLHVGGAAAVLHAGFTMLQVPVATLVKFGLDPTAVRYVTSLACWIAVLIQVYCCGICLGVSSARPSEQVLLGMTVAIGAGAQPVLANLSAGILLVLQRPYRVGDWITVGSETFEVTNIMLFFTHGQSAHAHITLPNAQAIGATVRNLSARHSQLLMVGVHVRCGFHTCAAIRKAVADAAAAYDAGAPDALERAGARDVGSVVPKCSHFGPLAVGKHGMRWELRVEVPLKAQLECSSLANECLHDALMAVGIKMFEEGVPSDGFM